MKIRPQLREAIRIEPGDYVAVVLNREATTEEIVHLKAELETHWPDVQVVIFPYPAEVQVMRPDRQEVCG